MTHDALQLIRVDLLKLRRRRGLIVLALTLLVGSVGLVFAINAVRHASNPVNGPAGGIKHFDDVTEFIGLIGLVVAAMIGATAGAGDAEAGVLRDLVASGRSRIALFASRAVAASALTVSLLVLALAFATACSVALAGSLPTPSLAHVAQHSAGVLAFGAMSALVAVGLATFARSRGPVIAVVITFGVVVSQLLLRISFLGGLRAILPLTAFERMIGEPPPEVHMSLALGIAVTAAWALAAVAAGGWWARRVEV